MMDILNAISKISKITNFATTIDYVTMRFIPGVFLACTLLMSYKQYVKNSIVCYTSIPFSGGIGLADYVENSCYLSKRYFNLLSNGTLEPLKHVNVYLWFPIILLLQTATLCLPKIFWIFIGNHTDLSYLLKLCYEITAQNKISKLLDRIRACNYKNFLAGYLLTKLLILIICCSNLLFLYYKIFLKDAYYPITIINRLTLFDTITAPPNSMFQEVVMCKTVVYQLGSINNVVAQCLLTWNPFYKNVFAVITFLLMLSTSLTLIDLLKWFIYYTFKKHVLLQYLQKPMMKNTLMIGYFAGTLSVDLYFLILMISTNVNDVIASEIVKELYLISITLSKSKKQNDDEKDINEIEHYYDI